MARITIEEIRKETERHGWEVVSTSYTNLKTEMQFKCDENHTIFLPWGIVRKNFVCPVCKNNRYKKNTQEIIPKKKNSIRVLALDQSTHKTGFSIFDDSRLIKYGVFEAELDDEIARISATKTWLLSMLESWNPDWVGIEGIQYQSTIGVTTFETLARLQGVLLETLYWEDVPYKVCPTNTWRAHCEVKGRHRADKKRSMQNIIKREYDVNVTDDEADAIGIGKFVADTITINKIAIQNWE